MYFLKALYIIFFIIFLKYEVDEKDKHVLKSIIDPFYLKIKEETILSLSQYLKPDIYLVVQPDTQGIFKEYVARYPKNYDFYLISKGFRSLEVYPCNIDSTFNQKRTLFLLDVDTLKYYKEFERKGIDYLFFEGQLVTKNHFVKETLFNLFKTSSHHYLPLYNRSYMMVHDKKIYLEYGDFQISLNLNKKCQEVRVYFNGIGTIHKVEYSSYNELDEELKDHFKNFYKNCGNENLFVISERYVNEMYEILFKKGIFRKKIASDEIIGLTEVLFPFKFCESQSQNLNESLFVSGGVCFDQIQSSLFFKHLFNFQILKRYGKRFIYTGIVKYDGKKTYVEII